MPLFCASPSTLAAELWREAGATPWIPAKHLLLLSEWIVDLAAGRRERAIIEKPPRHGKSEITSFWTPLWYLANFPDRRVILASYEADFAASWGRRVRNAIEAIGPRLGLKLAGDSSAANRWEVATGGGMFTTGIGGPLTGKGAHLLIIDDPVKNSEEAHSETIQNRNWEWWQSTARTRLEPQGAAVVVQTRWDQNDLAGRLLSDAASGGEQWDELRLPAVAEEGDQLGRAIGEPLWPERYDAEALKAIRRAVGERVWNALYQQRPSPLEGSIFKRGWWKYYKVLPADVRPACQSWDCAFKDLRTSDYVVGQVWGQRGAEYFLLDRIKDRLDFTATLHAIRQMTAKHPGAALKLIEDKANGSAVISVLTKDVPGIVAVNPEGGKEARAGAIAPLVEAGNVWLPDPTIAPWVGDFVEECAAFPNGAHDDQVDAMSQALLRLALQPGPAIWRPKR